MIVREVSRLMLEGIEPMIRANVDYFRRLGSDMSYPKTQAIYNELLDALLSS
jgi:hypothetical protein